MAAHGIIQTALDQAPSQGLSPPLHVAMPRRLGLPLSCEVIEEHKSCCQPSVFKLLVRHNKGTKTVERTYADFVKLDSETVVPADKRLPLISRCSVLANVLSCASQRRRGALETFLKSILANSEMAAKCPAMAAFLGHEQLQTQEPVASRDFFLVADDEDDEMPVVRKSSSWSSSYGSSMGSARRRLDAPVSDEPGDVRYPQTVWMAAQTRSKEFAKQITPTSGDQVSSARSLSTNSYASSSLPSSVGSTNKVGHDGTRSLDTFSGHRDIAPKPSQAAIPEPKTRTASHKVILTCTVGGIDHVKLMQPKYSRLRETFTGAIKQGLLEEAGFLAADSHIQMYLSGRSVRVFQQEVCAEIHLPHGHDVVGFHRKLVTSQTIQSRMLRLVKDCHPKIHYAVHHRSLAALALHSLNCSLVEAGASLGQIAPTVMNRIRVPPLQLEKAKVIRMLEQAKMFKELEAVSQATAKTGGSMIAMFMRALEAQTCNANQKSTACTSEAHKCSSSSPGSTGGTLEAPYHGCSQKSTGAKLRCPGGHSLRAYHTPDSGYWCDKCGKRMPNASTLNGCSECDYDICRSCTDKLQRSVQEVRDSPPLKLMKLMKQLSPRRSTSPRNCKQDGVVQPRKADEAAEAADGVSTSDGHRTGNRSSSAESDKLQDDVEHSRSPLLEHSERIPQPPSSSKPIKIAEITTEDDCRDKHGADFGLSAKQVAELMQRRDWAPRQPAKGKPAASVDLGLSESQLQELKGKYKANFKVDDLSKDGVAIPKLQSVASQVSEASS